MLTRIGSVEIWRILESVEAYMDPREFFPDMGEDGLSLIRSVVPRQLCPDTGLTLLPIQGFLIKTPQHTILVDACVGNDKTCDFFENWHKRSDGRFLAGLIDDGCRFRFVHPYACRSCWMEYTVRKRALDPDISERSLYHARSRQRLFQC